MIPKKPAPDLIRIGNRFFVVSDPTPVNVADLIRGYRNSLGRRSWLVPIPEKWVEALLKAAGRDSMWERLGCPLVALPTKLLAIGWNPTEPAPVRSCPG
jgi:UDP-glucose 4-epimerase